MRSKKEKVLARLERTAKFIFNESKTIEEVCITGIGTTKKGLRKIDGVVFRRKDFTEQKEGER